MVSPRRIKLGFVNAWLLPASATFVLVDSGLGLQRRRLEAELRAAGCGPGRLALLILTHADGDHAGNAARLQEDWGAKVAVHAEDAPALATGRLPPRSPLLSPRRLVSLVQALPRPRGRGCRPDLLLSEGQDLGAWGLRARIHHVPGHTAGSLAVVGEGYCIAGDLVSNYRRPGPGLLASDLEAYRSSLERLRALVPPSATVYPGHGEPFPAAALADIGLD